MKTLKIFTIEQQTPCGPGSSCCGPIGLTKEELDGIVNSVKKVFTGNIQIFDFMDKEVQKKHRDILSMVISFGWGALPIISIDEKVISIGRPNSEEQLLNLIKQNI